MSLKDSIMDAVKASMKAKEKSRVNALRLIQADIKRYEVDNRSDASDDIVIDILSKMLKQRRDSFQQYTDAGRTELAEQETYEMEIIQEFLPEALSKEEITTLINDAIAAVDANSMQDMGKVMGMLKPKLQGRADMSAVSKLIRERLQ